MSKETVLISHIFWESTKIYIKQFLQIWGLIKNYPDCCYGNDAKISRVNTLATDWLWKFSLNFVLIGTKVCRVWSSELAPEVPSVIMCSSFWLSTLFPGSLNRHVFHISTLATSSFEYLNPIEGFQENATRQLLAIPEIEFKECFYNGNNVW